jgi:anti-sigma factor ChrR (cupin superfamily)
MENQVRYGGSMNWQTSPARGVRRKRLFHSGAAEGGVVTSIVEYAPGSDFPEHGHPEGEEILVLDGTFSDERGDFPRGSYLLNPEGFRHAPYSRGGCTVFVKLRQYAGTGRERVCLDTTHGDWSAGPWPSLTGSGVRTLPLYRSRFYPERIQLIELAPGTELEPLAHPDGKEIFVISGEFSDERGVYPEHTWLLLPPGGVHRPKTAAGALLYVRQGGFGADRPNDGWAFQVG